MGIGLSCRAWSGIQDGDGFTAAWTAADAEEASAIGPQ
jgi:hypothetical protein